MNSCLIKDIPKDLLPTYAKNFTPEIDMMSLSIILNKD